MKRSATLSLSVIIIIVLAVIGYYYLTPQPTKPMTEVSTLKPAQQISVEIDFVPTGITTPFYAAVEEGIFTKYGLAVSIVPGLQSSSGAIRALSAGKVDFAEADIGALLVLRAKEGVTNIRAVALYYQHNPGGVIFIKGKGINQPRDLEGKAVCTTTGGGAVETSFPIFAQKTGIDLRKMNIQHFSANALNAALLAGSCDALLLFTRTVVDLTPDATKQGQQIGYFAYKDYGLDTYANMILARVDTIQNNPDLVKRFVQGYEDALQWSAAHPDAAAADTVKLNPQLDLAITTGEWKWTAALMGGDDITKAQDLLTLGYIDPAKMKSTIDTVSQAYDVPSPDPAEVYTNQFVKQP